MSVKSKTNKRTNKQTTNEQSQSIFDIGGVLSATVIVIGNGIGVPNSNLGKICSRFTSC